MPRAALRNPLICNEIGFVVHPRVFGESALFSTIRKFCIPDLQINSVDCISAQLLLSFSLLSLLKKRERKERGLAPEKSIRGEIDPFRGKKAQFRGWAEFANRAQRLVKPGVRPPTWAEIPGSGAAARATVPRDSKNLCRPPPSLAAPRPRGGSFFEWGVRGAKKPTDAAHASIQSAAARRTWGHAWRRWWPARGIGPVIPGPPSAWTGSRHATRTA